MPYALRDATGAIVALLRDPAPGASEEVDPNDPGVAAFLAHGESEAPFGRLDSEFVRVVEDLIDVLVNKGVLRVTDLPIEAQRKLSARKDMRQRIAEPVDPLDKRGVI